MTSNTVAKDPMLQFFRYEHLPEHLQAVSGPFGQLAMRIVENLPRNPERTVCLRKLLEAKDAAVRTVLYESPGKEEAELRAEQERMAPLDARD